jgi:predicted DNA-binding protein
MPIDKNKLTNEMIQKAMGCQNADELVALSKGIGIDITKEEAEAYLEELDDYELSKDQLDNVAGGGYKDCYCPENTDLSRS